MAPTPKPDGRQRPKFAPPHLVGKKPVVVHLKPDDYRLLHDLALEANTSMQETMRRLIRGGVSQP